MRSVRAEGLVTGPHDNHRDRGPAGEQHFASEIRQGADASLDGGRRRCHRRLASRQASARDSDRCATSCRERRCPRAGRCRPAWLRRRPARNADRAAAPPPGSRRLCRPLPAPPRPPRSGGFRCPRSRPRPAPRARHRAIRRAAPRPAARRRRSAPAPSRPVRSPRGAAGLAFAVDTGAGSPGWSRSRWRSRLELWKRREQQCDQGNPAALFVVDVPGHPLGTQQLAGHDLPCGPFAADADVTPRSRDEQQQTARRGDERDAQRPRRFIGDRPRHRSRRLSERLEKHREIARRLGPAALAASRGNARSRAPATATRRARRG